MKKYEYFYRYSTSIVILSRCFITASIMQLSGVINSVLVIFPVLQRSKVMTKDRLRNYLLFCFQKSSLFKDFWKKFSVSYCVTIHNKVGDVENSYPHFSTHLIVSHHFN